MPLLHFTAVPAYALLLKVFFCYKKTLDRYMPLILLNRWKSYVNAYFFSR